MLIPVRYNWWAILVTGLMMLTTGTIQAQTGDENQQSTAQENGTEESDAEVNERGGSTIGFYDGRLLLELKGVVGLNFAGAAAGDIENLYQPDIPFFTYLYGSDSQKLLANTIYSSAEQPELSSGGGTFMLEYGVLDWLGLGFALQHEAYKVKNIRSFDPTLFLPLALTSQISSGSSSSTTSQTLLQTLVNLEIIAPLQIGTVDFLKINTLDFILAFHFLDRSFLDPFVRVNLGFGQESELDANVLHVGATLGTRVFLTDGFYLTFEGDYSRYYLESNRGDAEINENLDESSVRAGLGYAF